MATIENSTYRFTYTITTNPTNVVATFTKLEYYSSYSGKSRINPQTSQIFYRDQAGSYNETGISIASIEFSGTGWKTIWTGTKVVTSYRQTYITSIGTNAGEIVVPVLPSYQITYNTDGGSTAPDTQLKYLGKDLHLTTARPTKTGYTFINWRSSSDNKLYAPGSMYTLDQSATMTAQWSANVYSITYNTNGGAGVANAQQKTYNEPLNFNDGSTIYRKETVNQITNEYDLLHWNTNPDDSGDSYALGSAIPNITNSLNVYAIWELKYLYPFVNNLQTYRTATSSISDKTRADKGEYIYISFDFVGCSDDAGSTYKVPDCKIQIDEDVYTPTLSFTTSPNGSLEFKAPTAYSYDNPHNILIEVSDHDYSGSKYSAYDYITTGIYPIDLFDNGQLNEVYMGVMHPYVNGVPLTLTDTYVDGNVDVRLDIDPNASAVTPAISGEDKDLFNKILSNGWYNDVINNNNILMLKQWANKVSGGGGSSSNEVYVNFVKSGTLVTDIIKDIVTEIGRTYPNMQSTIFKGRYVYVYSNVNYDGWFELMISDTSDIVTEGFPRKICGLVYRYMNLMQWVYSQTSSLDGTTKIYFENITSSRAASDVSFIFDSGFAKSTNDPPYVLRRNGVINLTGACVTTTAITAGYHRMCILPDGFWPSRTIRTLSYGNGKNTFLLFILATGGVYIDRYGLTSTTSIPSGETLNLTCCYFGSFTGILSI